MLAVSHPVRTREGRGGRKKKSGLWIGKGEKEAVSKSEMESKKEVGHMSEYMYMHFGHVYIYMNFLKCTYPHYVVLAEVHSPSNSSTC